MSSIARSRKKYRCFNEKSRYLLECHLTGRMGIPKTTNRRALAKIFECDVKTIYNEIKRGTVDHLTSELETVYVYNAEYAQHKADFENTAKGAPLKIGHDKVLCEAIRHLVIDINYSPYAVWGYFDNNGWPTKTRICEKTLYNYIYAGIIYGVKKEDLPNKGIKYREKGSTRRYSKGLCAKKSIETRPAEVEDRETFGHWEIDTIKGGTNKGTECLLTITERKSRMEIAVKMPNAKAETTVAALNDIETNMGLEDFKSTFHTITSDGGSEFMDADGMEKSINGGEKRTTVYYAHPYSAYERGTNEIHNRLLRRFFPKGTNFSQVTDEQIAEAVDWMNNYPRRILGGKTPNMVFTACLLL